MRHIPDEMLSGNMPPHVQAWGAIMLCGLATLGGLVFGAPGMVFAVICGGIGLQCGVAETRQDIINRTST